MPSGPGLGRMLRVREMISESFVSGEIRLQRMSLSTLFKL